MRRPGWRRLLRIEGPGYLRWLEERRVLETRLGALSQALGEFLIARVASPSEAFEFLRAVPAVLNRCNEGSTYDLPAAADAYAWLHLLDRYARTWRALEEMVQRACLPLGKQGVRALDVGAGPGPAALAVADFYRSLGEFGQGAGVPRFHQQADVTCIEASPSVNSFRHHLVEFLNDHLQLAGAIPDFSTFHPPDDRRAYRSQLLAEDYYNEVPGYEEPLYTVSEANDAAQSLHRYRLLIFSNFLTTLGTVEGMEATLRVVFADLQPGAAVMVLGAGGGEYPRIYDFVDRLAAESHLTLCLADAIVRAEGEREQESILAATGRVYHHLRTLCSTDDIPEVIREHFSNGRPWPSRSRLRVYRKFRSASSEYAGGV